MTVSTALHHRSAPIVNQLLLGMGGILLLACVGWLQGELDRRQDRTVVQIEGLAQLPKGEYLKPALLGYHHLGADILWLRLLQVMGKKRNSADEYEWMYHALDVITTLDPQYAYAYYVGGNILGDLANRPDLGNRLLEKGANANPEVWYIPFLLGYNYYFLLGDPAKGAEYIMKAAGLPDRPAYLPGLATRMAAEAGSPETALAFLEARLLETQDPETRESLANRMKEVIIERDLRLLESAVEAYRTQHRAPSPDTQRISWRRESFRCCHRNRSEETIGWIPRPVRFPVRRIRNGCARFLNVKKPCCSSSQGRAFL